MYCKYCGKPINENAMFCEHCGKPQNENAIETKQTTPSNLFESFQKKPMWLVYAVWVLINLICLSRCEYSDKYYILFPSEHLEGGFWDFAYYRFSDFVVYAFLIPITIYVLYNYFKIKRNWFTILSCAGWYLWHIILFCTTEYSCKDKYGYWTSSCVDVFYPFGAEIYGTYYYPFFANSYDLREFVVFAMLLPSLFFGYRLYKERKS